MADYRNFLATNILTEDKVVTYRLLSRTLKIHVNDAKEMLYDFHRQQNAKKPGTIHATYLISGTKGKEEPLATNGAAKKDGEDDYMQSSPFMASSMPAAEGTGESGVLSITLVKEENLEEVRSQYEHISSIHVYSIGPHPLKDLQILSDITREIQVLCASEDAVESAPKYGTILNKNVTRRPARRPPPVAAAPVPGPAKAAVKPKLAEAKEAVKPTIKQETKPSQPSTANEFFGKGKAKAKPAASSNPSSKESTPNPPTLKRDSSSIFKSFAKAKPKLKREGTDSSAVESPAMSAAEDSPMKDVVSDDEEDTYAPPPPSKEIVDSDRKSRKEREAALKKMMEDEDEDEVVVKPKPKRKEKEIVDVEEEVEEEEEEEKEKSVEKEEIPITVSGGRRRGRRRVMKKKTVKDDEGYLVTKEEPVWESFSEDEPVEKPKPKAQASNTTAKTKKSAAKAGQGNIMSFFGKK